MNLSLIVTEKIRNYFNLPSNQFVSLADMARTVDKDDFAFLADVPDNQQNNKDLVDKIYASKYFFSYLANSLPDSRELVWNPEINPDNTLEKKYPNVLEKAKLNRKNQAFVKKWTEEDQHLELSTLREPLNDVPFLETSCTPSFYDKIEQPWTKITLNAAELATLDNTVRGKYPASLYDEVDPLLNGEKLDIQSLSFEIQLASIVRGWFNQSLFDSHHWKMDGGEILSNGANSTEGKLPAYTSTLIFVKNVQWGLVPGSANNVTVLKKIQNGTLTLGSLPIQGIPVGVNLSQLQVLQSSPLNARQYVIFNQNIQDRLDKGDLIIKNGAGHTTGGLQSNGTGTLSTTTDKVKVIDPVVTAPNTTTVVNTGAVLSTTPILLHTTPILPNPVVGHPILMGGMIGRRGGESPTVTKANLKYVQYMKAPYRSYEYTRYFPAWFDELHPVEATFTVSGFVRIKGSNTPLPDATVTLLFGDGKRLLATTDKNGQYTVSGIAKGHISIIASKGNYETKEETFVLAANLSKDFLLSPVGSNLPAGTFFLFGVVSTRFPSLPNPQPDGEYVEPWEAIDV